MIKNFIDFYNIDMEKEIWKDIFKNIKNIIRILFLKFIWIIIGAIVIFLLMIPAIKASDLSILHAVIISIAGGIFGNFLALKKNKNKYE